MTDNTIQSVCVYCASSTGANPSILEATVALGGLLADRDIELVYGGGAVGLMGLVADTVMGAGGRVTGIIPTGLFPKEVGHSEITELVEVETMHERKAEMIRRADGFIALPGGFGTLEELAEVLTWGQLGIHQKPVGLLNIDGFYDGLLAFFDRCVSEGILKEKNRRLLLDRTDPRTLLDAFDRFEPVVEKKWLGRDPL